MPARRSPSGDVSTIIKEQGTYARHPLGRTLVADSCAWCRKHLRADTDDAVPRAEPAARLVDADRRSSCTYSGFMGTRRPHGGLAKINLTVRGIKGLIEHGESFHAGHHSDLKTDFIFANGSMSSNQSGEEGIRKSLSRWALRTASRHSLTSSSIRLRPWPGCGFWLGTTATGGAETAQRDPVRRHRALGAWSTVPTVSLRMRASPALLIAITLEHNGLLSKRPVGRNTQARPCVYTWPLCQHAAAPNGAVISAGYNSGHRHRSRRHRKQNVPTFVMSFWKTDFATLWRGSIPTFPQPLLTTLSAR